MVGGCGGWHGDGGWGIERKKKQGPGCAGFLRRRVNIRCTFDGRFPAGFFVDVPVLRDVDGEAGPLPTLDAVLTGIVLLRNDTQRETI